MLRFAAVLLLAVLTGCSVGWHIAHSDREERRTPLERAAQEGNAAEVRRLLASGADPNDRGGWFACPLQAAAFGNNNIEIIRALLAAGADPNCRPPEERSCWVSPLRQAASNGDVEATRTLLDAGAALEQPECSKLMVGWLQPPIAELLVERGLDLFAVDENGRNELHLALAPPGVPPAEGIRNLIRAGVPLNARDVWGKTPLACWREPRDYEVRRFTTWLMERLGVEHFRDVRETRKKVSAILAEAGATL